MAGVEEVFLSQVGEGGADAEGDVGVIVEDEMDAVVLAKAEQGDAQLGDGGGVHGFGAELEEIGATVDELGGEGERVAAMEVGGIDEGVELALVEGFHGRERCLVAWWTPRRCVPTYGERGW
jgi:hypothetical protein